MLGGYNVYIAVICDWAIDNLDPVHRLGADNFLSDILTFLEDGGYRENKCKFLYFYFYS